jgi:hypothetical protein
MLRGEKEEQLEEALWMWPLKRLTIESYWLSVYEASK